MSEAKPRGIPVTGYTEIPEIPEIPGNSGDIIRNS